MLVRSSSKVGFQITESRLMLLDTKVESVRLPYGAQTACCMNALSRAAYCFSVCGVSCCSDSLSICLFSAGVLFCENTSLLVLAMFSPLVRMSKKSFGCGKSSNQSDHPMSRFGVLVFPMIVK